METLPPVHLGATIFMSFSAALVLRKPFLAFLVDGRDAAAQPRWQFTGEMAACLFAGLLAAIYNQVFVGFPMGSGLILMIGCAVIGFFIALDMALKKERAIIRNAARSDREMPPPKRFFPMTRKFSLVAAATSFFVAVVMMLVLSRDFIWLSKVAADPVATASARMSVIYEIAFIMGVLLILIVNLILSYARNLKLLFDNETGVLEHVSNGDFSKTVPVATRDEFGFIAGHTNEMIRGLRHRMELITALKLAEEVQQSLLPEAPPRTAGVDISGTSRYCEETGGDYYDYFLLPGNRLAVVVADAADHGIGSALHMSTARALIRSCIDRYEGPVPLLEEVNRFLAHDSRETGRFLTLFFLEIAPETRQLRWVRAGHDPALLYESSPGGFQLLDGKGVAIGLADEIFLEAGSRDGWTPGSVILIGTDGIREARNESGEMFGNERIRDVVARHADGSAGSIQTAMLDALKDFTGPAAQEDDITLVVIKLS